MAQLVNNKVFSDSRGSLAVIDEMLPFPAKRVFFIFDANSERGGHRHKETRIVLICTSGECFVHVTNPRGKNSYHLTGPAQHLLLEPEDYHTMDGFTKGATLVALASKAYDPDDYIYDNYE